MQPIEEQEVNLRDYLRVIQKRKWIVLTSFIVVVVVTGVITQTRKPVYRATTTILIERERLKVIPFEEVFEVGAAQKDYYETQYGLLKSRSLVRRVFDELNLWKDPSFSIGAFIKRLDVKPIRGSNLVEVSFEGHAPVQITEIVNTLAGVYIAQDLETKLNASRYAVGWLSEQLVPLKEKLAESELAFQRYKEEQNIASLTKEEEKITDLIGVLKEKDATLMIELANLSARYKEKHPKMISLRSELQSVREELNKAEESLLALNEKAIQYNVLKREVETNQQLYSALLERAQETSLVEELKATNIRVIDPAEVPQKPIRPRKQLNALIAIVIGLSGGIGLAFFFESVDVSIKNPDDIKNYTDLPFLGHVPNIKMKTEDEFSREMLAYKSPKSIESEAYRSIRTNIVFSSPQDQPIKTLLVTSPAPMEGKTLTLTNLGITMAQAGKDILLLSGDMRRSRLHKIFGLDNSVGLSNLLVGDADLDSAIQRTKVPNLSIIASGYTPPNPAELLDSKKMVELMQSLKERFDRILIDSPPVISPTDATILSIQVDGVILVIEGGKTSREIARRAAQQLADVKAKTIGVILNKVTARPGDYYYYPYYKYYHEEEPEGDRP